MIDRLASYVSPSLIGLSGKVFYSGRAAFSSPRPYYLLGYNPGGAPETHAAETIARHTDYVLRSTPDRWSEYVDASWEGRPTGAARLQRRIRHFLGRLGLDPRDVPASNLIFTRSRRSADLGADTHRLEEMCWPFHRQVVEGLGTRAIFCLGGETGDRLRARLGATILIDSFIEANNRGWQSTAWQAPEGRLVFSLTHPAIADWTKPETDPSEMVNRCLDRLVL